MLKRFLSVFLCVGLLFTQLVAVNAENTSTAEEAIESAFTDAAFLGAVREAVGKTNNEPIYKSDVENITTLDVTDKYIENLQGIEYFTALKELNCSDNEIRELDLFNNTKLETLDCSYNVDLISLNVLGCPELKILDCYYTGLQRLDVRKNPKLTHLTSYGSYLRTLNISNNPLLEVLDTFGTYLVSLDVSNNNKLTYLDCSYNNMASSASVTGIENCTLLDDDTYLFEPQNTDAITELFTDEKFLDVVRDKIGKPDGDIYPSDVDEITDITINNNGLTSLDGVEFLTSLKTIDCTDNRIETLDLYNNKELKTVKCANNELVGSLDLSDHAQLEKLEVADNYLTDVDVSHSSQLNTIDVTNNVLPALDLSNNINVKEVLCSDNVMSSREALKLPTTFDSQLSEEADESFVTLMSVDNIYTLAFLPQAGGKFNIKHVTSGTEKLLSSGDGSPRSTIKIYDITNVSRDGIPAQYFRDETEEEKELKEGGVHLDVTNSDDMEALEKLIERAGEPVGEFSTGRNKSFNAETYLNNNHKNKYKFLSVLYNLKTDKEAAVIRDVDSTLPYVKSLTFNNNHGSGLIDVYGSTNPTLMTYGLFGYKSTFTVAINDLEGIVDKAYICVERRYQDNVQTDDRNKDIELTKMSDGTFQKALHLSGGNSSNLADELSKGKIKVKCKYSTDPDDLETLHEIYEKDVKLIFDPSGYIYEAVPSNRLNNVKTILYLKDQDGAEVKWDASEYGQENPRYTDKNGYYEWFVPSGLWQVRAEHEGYEPYSTDWMRVPPTRMDVNFGMISKEKPSIAQLYAYPDMIEINFNKYVYAEDITTDNIAVYANGEQIQGRLALVNAETDSWTGEHDTSMSGGTGKRYVSKIKFRPNNTLSLNDNITVGLSKNIRSYAGVNPDNGYTKDAIVKVRPDSMTVGSDSPVLGAGGNNTIYYGETSTVKMSIMPIAASAGQKLILTNENPWAVSVPAEVVVGEDGMAEIPMTGLALGSATITMSLENSNISTTCDIEVDIHQQ